MDRNETIVEEERREEERDRERREKETTGPTVTLLNTGMGKATH